MLSSVTGGGGVKENSCSLFTDVFSEVIKIFFLGASECSVLATVVLNHALYHSHLARKLNSFLLNVGPFLTASGKRY